MSHTFGEYYYDVYVVDALLTSRKVTMPNELEKLIEAAKTRDFPKSEREAQRRSFAYGNTKIENPRITRQTVDQQAEELESQATAR